MQRGKSNLAVTVLHVSDTQFGAYHRFSADDSLAGHLIRDVAGLIGGQGVPRPDLIVLSGDITERARADEFGQKRAFLDALCAELELGPERVVVVPGNHDINWGHSKAAFADWEADHDGDPPVPYARKWRNYREFVTGLHGEAAFTEDQPYRLHDFGAFGVAVAALNSTIRESHRGEDHYGWCGDGQLRWFADQLRARDDVLRIGVVHHNVRRGETADNENLRDADALTRILGDRLDLLLHGHTHEGKSDYLANGTLVLATGSAAVAADWRPAEVPNQYQVMHFEPGRVTRWARQWDNAGRRWIADPRVSRSGNDGRVIIDLPTPGRAERDDTAPGLADPAHRHGAEFPGRQDRRQDFADDVARVTRVDLAKPGAMAMVPVETREQEGLRYVLGFPPGAPVRCVGVLDGSRF